MAINKGVSDATLLKNQPNSIKKVINNVHELNKLGSVLNKEVASLQSELGKWRF